MNLNFDQSTSHDTMSVMSSLQKQKQYYSINKLSGLFQQHDPITGHLLEEGHFQNGKQVGLWKVIDQDGHQQHFMFVQIRVGARCRDGSLSSGVGRGTCSWHGGVDQWLVDTKRENLGGTGKYRPLHQRIQQGKQIISNQFNINIHQSNDQLLAQVMERLIKLNSLYESSEQKNSQQMLKLKQKHSQETQILKFKLQQQKRQNEKLIEQVYKSKHKIQNSQLTIKYNKQQIKYQNDENINKDDTINEKTQVERVGLIKKNNSAKKYMQKELQQIQKHLDLLNQKLLQNINNDSDQQSDQTKKPNILIKQLIKKPNTLLSKRHLSQQISKKSINKQTNKAIQKGKYKFNQNQVQSSEEDQQYKTNKSNQSNFQGQQSQKNYQDEDLVLLETDSQDEGQLRNSSTNQ